MRARILPLITAVVHLSGCIAPAQSPVDVDAFVPPSGTTLTKGIRSVDLLVVVDNSGGMGAEQQGLRAEFPALLAALRRLPEGFPDLHLGVTTTDLGTGRFPIPHCEEPGGDAGLLVTGSCSNPMGGSPYLIDVQARGCEITREVGSNHCVSHGCGPQHCEHEPTSFFVQDAVTGCPRCRNYDTQTLADAFSCLADVGEDGYGFEQPLEAMFKALDDQSGANAGFVRPDASLTVLLLVDEDDCSASNPELYNDTQTDMSSPLGPLQSYRCFEFGVTCDINDRTHVGTRHNCVPREDNAALLVSLDRYEQDLRALKEPRMLFVAAIAGPVTDSANGVGFDVEVVRDSQDHPVLGNACSGPGEDGATAGIRIHSFVSRFQTPDDLASWAFSSSCANSFVPPLAALGGRLAEEATIGCVGAPLAGCVDPGVVSGTPQAPQRCETNSRCQPRCVVTRIHGGGLIETTYEAAPPCLEVCVDGPCPGNADTTLAYAAGHPQPLDPSLPVSACWHIEYNPLCARSNGARLLLARQSGGTHVAVSCDHIPRREENCADAADNDEDCLVDLEDPDCE